MRNPKLLIATLFLLSLALAAALSTSAAGSEGGGSGAVHYLRPNSAGPPLGACEATTDSNSSSAFSLGGGQMSSSPLNLALSTANLPSGVSSSAFQTALSNAVGTWEATDLPNTAFGNINPTSAELRVRRDGVSVVAFNRKGVGGAVGLTVLQQFDGSGNLVEADMLLNPKFPWSTFISGNADTGGSPAGCAGEAGKFDVEAVLTHELGHWVRLEHIGNDVQTMFSTIGTGETRKRTLGAGDTAGANSKY